MQAKNKENWKIRTDLAVELTENLGKNQKTRGEVEVEEGITMEINGEGHVKETVIRIKNEKGEKTLGKPCGCYITLEGEDLSAFDENYHENVSQMLRKRLEKMLASYGHILVVGLGNQQVTADSLGPLVLQNLHLTRHLKRERLWEGERWISGIAPGVMAQTGMEAGEIVRALVKEISPEVVLAVDALAARNVQRLNRTIQISDTGIAPGLGVGNHRMELTEKTLGVKVIAIGVPTVISVPTLVSDALSPYLEEGEELAIEDTMDPALAEMFVTPKNVDEAVKKISYTISEAVNQAAEA